MGIVVRAWQKNDIAAILRITWKSWVAAYSSFIPESDLRSYFETHYTEDSLLGMFDDPFTQVFVAQRDHKIAGYIRLFFNRVEGHLSVPSFYFLPDFQNQGMGSRLLEAAENDAREKGHDQIWIGAMVKNKRALTFYRKAGFLFVREEPFTMGRTTVSHVIGYKKLGKSSLRHQKTYGVFDQAGGAKSLPELCLELLSEQKEVWPGLRENYESLKKVREREVRLGGFSVNLQYNPGRMRNSLAVVGEENKRPRSCFLCLDHLPEYQKGILYRGEYFILCNPMPVFSPHFTIAHLDHRRQAIGETIDDLLHMMADFGSNWTILYNGPQCGASAPDHLHLQAIPSRRMPTENAIREGKRLTPMKRMGTTILYRMRDLGREFVVLKGDDPVGMRKVLEELLHALSDVHRTPTEPMINTAGFREQGKWHLAIFPRRKHRPEVFFKEGDARVIVSPGAIDMSGLLITPVEKDFNRLDTADVERIYREVSLEEETVQTAIDAMR